MHRDHRPTPSPALAYPRLWQGIGWLLVSIVTFLTLMPEPPQPVEFFGADKLYHLLAYAVMMLWFARAFRARLLWAVFLAGLGVVLETLQGLMGYREFEYPDMLANGLGVACGLLLAATPLAGLVERLDRILMKWQRG